MGVGEIHTSNYFSPVTASLWSPALTCFVFCASIYDLNNNNSPPKKPNRVSLWGGDSLKHCYNPVNFRRNSMHTKPWCSGRLSRRSKAQVCSSRLCWTLKTGLLLTDIGYSLLIWSISRAFLWLTLRKQVKRLARWFWRGERSLQLNNSLPEYQGHLKKQSNPALVL